jgi:NitT/TauT family transport system permease protein
MYDTAETVPPVRSRSWLRFHMARSEFLHTFWVRAVRPVIFGIVALVRLILERERTLRASVVVWLLTGGFVAAIIWGISDSIAELTRPAPLLLDIPSALIFSFLRLLAAYALALAWTLPLAVWIGRNERMAKRVMPVIEVIASIPATAFFPLIVLFILRRGGDMNFASILLVTTGMQWYLLFNLIAGVRAIPEDLRQIADSLGLHGWTKWKRLILPAIYPSMVTGSLTAIGGGWNALVLSEYVMAEGRVYSVHGIGALLDYGTYESGSLQLIVMSITAMVLFILIINRFVWQPAYQLAQRRFALNY